MTWCVNICCTSAWTSLHRTRVEELAVCASSDLVNDRGLQRDRTSASDRVHGSEPALRRAEAPQNTRARRGKGGGGTSRSRKTQRGTCLPAPVSEKNVLNASSPPPIVLSEGICPSGWMPCSRQYSSQQALPTCVSARSHSALQCRSAHLWTAAGPTSPGDTTGTRRSKR